MGRKFPYDKPSFSEAIGEVKLRLSELGLVLYDKFLSGDGTVYCLYKYPRCPSPRFRHTVFVQSHQEKETISIAIFYHDLMPVEMTIESLAQLPPPQRKPQRIKGGDMPDKRGRV
jgi:hypothetical protein